MLPFHSLRPCRVLPNGPSSTGPAGLAGAADLVMVNCEGALSDHARQVGSNRTPEKFAVSMKNAGIGVVNLANNHTFDAEERGFLDTLRAFSLAGIAIAGGEWIFPMRASR